MKIESGPLCLDWFYDLQISWRRSLGDGLLVLLWSLQSGIQIAINQVLDAYFEVSRDTVYREFEYHKHAG